MLQNAIRAPKKKKQWSLLLFALPFMAAILFLKYVPIAGWVLSFFQYRPGKPLFQCEFVGLEFFRMIFTDRDILNAFKNTVIFSGIGYLLSPLPMVFAIFLNEIQNTRMRKMAQTITTFPHFISWVIVYSLAFAIFSTNGVINNVFYNRLGWLSQPTALLSNKDAVYLFQVAISQWKGLGWSSIIYVAAISGIDQGLYEAAQIDGAGRLRCAIHITLPGLMPTFLVLLLLSISNFINTGYEQYYVFKNAVVFDKIEVLDLYIYRMGMQLGDYSYATAVGIVKSLISIVMLFLANGIAKCVRGSSII